MGWKNWPYWLKGGIITLIIWLVLLLLTGIVDFQIRGIIPPILFGLGYEGHWSFTSEAGIFNAIFYTMIGLIIGTIYGRIKSRGIQ